MFTPIVHGRNIYRGWLSFLSVVFKGSSGGDLPRWHSYAFRLVFDEEPVNLTRRERGATKVT